MDHWRTGVTKITCGGRLEAKWTHITPAHWCSCHRTHVHNRITWAVAAVTVLRSVLWGLINITYSQGLRWLSMFERHVSDTPFRQHHKLRWLGTVKMFLSQHECGAGVGLSTLPSAILNFLMSSIFLTFFQSLTVLPISRSLLLAKYFWWWKKMWRLVVGGVVTGPPLARGMRGLLKSRGDNWLDLRSVIHTAFLKI